MEIKGIRLRIGVILLQVAEFCYHAGRCLAFFLAVVGFCCVTMRGFSKSWLYLKYGGPGGPHLAPTFALVQLRLSISLLRGSI